jgi:curved DNA-binding protein
VDHYKTLGLHPKATPDEIRRAYRILARRYHPDVNPQSNSEHKFRQIAQAYAILSDPDKRKDYDKHIKPNEYKPRPKRPLRTPPKKSSIVEGLKKLFSRTTKAISVPTPSKVSVIEVSISVEEAIKGGVKTIDFVEPEAVRRISVTIPRGARDGEIVRVSSKSAREDIICAIRHMPHPILSLERKGLVVRLPITLSEAITGARITVPTLDDPITLTIPRLCQSGTELRVKGKGIETSKGRGDIYYQILIKLPDEISLGVQSAIESLNYSVKRNLPNPLV